MIKEIRIVQQVCHRNNVELLHVVRQSRNAYPVLIFEFVSERTLYETIPFLTSEEVPRIAHQMLLGIGHAHSVGVVHNDLKPENIMIARDRQVLKIIDWGLGEIYNKGKRLYWNVFIHFYFTNPHISAPYTL
jgi:casein kinase II subunit alpha